MRGNLTTFEYALLGLIGTAPMAGYDVRKVFVTTPLGHFSASPGAIYPALGRLAHSGLLRATLDRTVEARPRRVYSLTKAGRDTLDAWVRQPVTREEIIRGAGAPVLRFALAEGRLSRDEVLEYLKGYQIVLDSYLEELGEHARRLPKSASLHGRLALELGIRGLRSELAWAKSAAETIKCAPRRGSQAARG